jgi:hypothetical protein
MFLEAKMCVHSAKETRDGDAKMRYLIQVTQTSHHNSFLFSEKPAKTLIKYRTIQ